MKKAKVHYVSDSYILTDQVVEYTQLCDIKNQVLDNLRYDVEAKLLSLTVEILLENGELPSAKAEGFLLQQDNLPLPRAQK